MISIIVPSYNRAYVLPRAIASVRSQGLQDWELLIVDDGSSDDTRQVVESAGDPRIRYLHQQNAGPSAARNTGMDAAQGEWILYLDSDDVFLPDAFEAIATCNGTYGICGHRRTIVFVDPQGNVLAEKADPQPGDGQVTLQDFYDWRVKTTSSGLFHRRTFRARWRDVLIEDLEFILQLGAADPRGFCFLPGPYVDYRQVYGGDGLCSAATYGLFARAFGTIYEWHRNDPLMKNPDVYLSRVHKYTRLQAQVEAGEIPPPQYKYFPELWQS